MKLKQKTNAHRDEEVGRKRVVKLSVNRNHVIYPENRYIRFWDAMMLVLVGVYAFTVPYHLGISGGIHLLQSVGWFIVTVFMNSLFFVDTFLYFFRAYRDTSGRMVIDPKTIRRRYLRSLFIPNLLSNLPTTIVFYLYGRTMLSSGENPSGLQGNSALLVLINSSNMLKLLRLGRASSLLTTSEYVREIREQRKAYTVRLWVFVFLIVVVAHWFACIWSFVAFVEARGFSAEQISTTDNWINLWYTDNFVQGGLDPVGWDNDTNRYVLSLFWAIQTITSIGYGNIVPFTPAEWWVASVLQLMAGIMWAYVIGGLVGVVTAMEVKAELFRDRIDNANYLISVFYPEEKLRGKKNKNPDLAQKEKVAKRIRRYIHTQKERPTSNFRCISSLDEAFPVLRSLSPDLRRNACLMLVKGVLERVPYLSSRFLTADEQSLLATKCFIREIPCGESYRMNHGIDSSGRGISLQLSGLASRTSSLIRLMPILSGGVFGDGTVLLDEGSPDADGTLRFLSYSVLIFVPRQAVLAALASNPTVWTKCARWKYLGACLVAKAAAIRQAQLNGDASAVDINHKSTME